MINYNINYNRLALAIVPLKLRKMLLMGFCYCLLTGVRRAASVFEQFRADTDFRLHHNGQVCYLRAALNDRFDWEQRRITIGEIDLRESLTIHTRSVLRPVMVPERESGAVILNRRAYTVTGSADFVVVVPQDVLLMFTEEQIRALVDTFKLASKRYILTFN